MFVLQRRRALEALTLDFMISDFDRGATSYADFPAYIAGDPATFARSASAFYEDSTLTSVASGSPRVGSRGLLIEPSKTNLSLWSQELDNGYWNSNGGTRTADAVVAPDGTTTAEQWVGSDSWNGVYGSEVSFTAGTTYTLSVFWKPISGTASASIGIGGSAFNTGSGDRQILITPSGGTPANFTEATAYGVIPMANGWYRAWVKFTATATATSVAVLYYGPDSGSKTWSFWGVQIETGDLSSYIPTTSTTVTRPADDLVLSLPTGTTKLYVTLESGAVVLLSGLSAGNYSFPTNLAERYIKGISNMNPVGAEAGTPAAVGTLSDIYLAEATGNRTRATAPAFSGGGTYSLVGAPAGVSIDSSTGVLTVNTATSGRMAQTTFTVRKTQGAATADQPCKLLVGPPIWFSMPSGQAIPASNAVLADWMSRMAGFGAKGVRMDLDWNHVEAVENTLVWTDYDRLFDYAAAAGLKVMWIIKNTPPWASAGGAWNDTPTNQWRFGVFCEACSAHFSGARQVDHWEVWNEPNKTGSTGFLNVTNANFKWSYPDLLYFAHVGLKNNRSSNIVIGGALTSTPTPGDATNYPTVSAVADIIDVMTTYHSSEKRWDGYSQHVYTTPYSPLITDSWSAFQILSSCMSAFDTFTGDTSTDIYLTEFGAPTGGTSGDLAWVLTEAQQRQQLVDLLHRMTQPALINRVKLACWYAFGDWNTEGQHPSQDHTEEHFGVIRLPNGDGVEKPVGQLLREYGVA